MVKEADMAELKYNDENFDDDFDDFVISQTKPANL